MEIELFADAIDDYQFWQRSGNTGIRKKIERLFSSMLETPFDGIGKPEPLKYDFSGKWLRRINEEHRIVYDVIGDTVRVFSLRGHY